MCERAAKLRGASGLRRLQRRFAHDRMRDDGWCGSKSGAKATAVQTLRDFGSASLISTGLQPGEPPTRNAMTDKPTKKDRSWRDDDFARREVFAQWRWYDRRTV